MSRTGSTSRAVGLLVVLVLVTTIAVAGTVGRRDGPVATVLAVEGTPWP